MGAEEFASHSRTETEQSLEEKLADEYSTALVLGAVDSQELYDIMFALSHTTGASNIEHEEWIGLATGLQKARNHAKWLEGHTPDSVPQLDILKEWLTKRQQSLREKAVRVGADAAKFEGLLQSLGIVPSETQEQQ